MPQFGVTTVLVVEGADDGSPPLGGALASWAPDLLVERAQRLPQALEWLRAHSPDVIVVDLDLPGGHGVDALVVLRTRAPRVPIVAVAERRTGEGSRALRSGADACLGRGDLSGASVGAAIETAVARRRALDQVQAGR